VPCWSCRGGWRFPFWSWGRARGSRLILRGGFRGGGGPGCCGEVLAVGDSGAEERNGTYVDDGLLSFYADFERCLFHVDHDVLPSKV